MSPGTPESELFDGGPPRKLQSRIGLIAPGRPNVARRMLLAILVCWAPLAVLTAIEGTGAFRLFLADFGAHTRYLVAAPVLILAESICLPRMSTLAHAFLHAGLVAPADRGRFDAATASTRRLLDSTPAEIAVIVLAYLVVLWVYQTPAQDMIPAWHRISGGTTRWAPAGWWGLLVSLPVLLALQIGWLWRLVLWARFLWLMSRLPLKLVPAHPDGAAGLKFVGYSAQTFTLLGFAFGSIAAGSVANEIAAGATIMAYKYFIGGFAACVIVLLNAPLLVFFDTLLGEWRRGTFEYGALADSFGREFERKWFDRKAPLGQGMLERQDFSAATDLYQVVDRVYAMGYVPIHLRSVVLLAAATLVPFVPVVLLSLPFDVIVNHVASLLL